MERGEVEFLTLKAKSSVSLIAIAARLVGRGEGPSPSTRGKYSVPWGSLCPFVVFEASVVVEGIFNHDGGCWSYVALASLPSMAAGKGNLGRGGEAL